MKNLLARVSIEDNLFDAQGKTIGTKYQTISPLISTLLKNSLTIAGIIFLGLLLFGGFSMIANAGSNDSKKAAQAKQTVTSAVVGFIVVFFAYLIIQLIEAITGLNILNSDK